MRFQTCPWLGGPFLTWEDLSMSWGPRCIHWTQGLVLVFVLNPSVRSKCNFCYHSSGNQIKCCNYINREFFWVLNCLAAAPVLLSKLCWVQIECGAASPAKNSLNPSEVVSLLHSGHSRTTLLRGNTMHFHFFFPLLLKHLPLPIFWSQIVCVMSWKQCKLYPGPLNYSSAP